MSAKEVLKPTREQNPEFDVGRPRRLTSPPFMQIEMDDRQSQTKHRRFTDNEPYNTLLPFWSHSATAESVLAAEYQEWPLHGFLKRTRVRNTTSFNLELHLADLPEHLELSGLSEALRSSIEASAQHETFHSAVAHCRTRHVKLRHPTKRIPWTKEEHKTLVKMKEEDGCSWEEISGALPSHSPGQFKYATTRSSGAPPLSRENIGGDRSLSSETIS